MRGIISWVGIMAMAAGAQAQTPRIGADDVGRIYAEARSARAYDAFIAEYGATVHPRTPQVLPVASDSFGIWVRWLNPALPPEQTEESSALNPFENWVVIRPENRADVQHQFDEVQWAYLGNNYFTTLDTLSTHAIRARMERRFGAPTRTLVEQEFLDGVPVESMQFEYWMVVNDSVLVMFMDTGGPFDRGILVSGDHRYRNELYRLRQTLLGAILADTAPAPHVDYFFNSVTERWYRTGYNGEAYFLREIRPPNLSRGRPELVDADR